jgi:hypothetical protein
MLHGRMQAELQPSERRTSTWSRNNWSLHWRASAGRNRPRRCRAPESSKKFYVSFGPMRLASLRSQSAAYGRSNLPGQFLRPDLLKMHIFRNLQLVQAGKREGV